MGLKRGLKKGVCKSFERGVKKGNNLSKVGLRAGWNSLSISLLFRIL